MTILPLRNSLNHAPSRRGFLLIPFALAIALLALPHSAKAADGAVGDGTSTAEGTGALQSLTFGFNDTATGYLALFRNTTGSENTATGVGALQENTDGSFNTANGQGALSSNTLGFQNTATGAAALNANNGNNNTADGDAALTSNTVGHDNTADGIAALLNNTAGSNNVALGSYAGRNLTTGSNNIMIGANVFGSAGESNRIRIGKGASATFISGIFGKTVASGVGVIVNSNGQLGTVQSSAHFKEAIKPMDKASEAILSLQPVTFRYKHELDPDGIPQFGLVAEQVEKVNPELVVRDEDGKVNTVRYEAVNAMLLNEFLKEHRRIEEQCKHFESKLADQQKAFEAKFAQQQKEIEALGATIQKVSDQVAVNKPAPQLVTNL